MPLFRGSAPTAGADGDRRQGPRGCRDVEPSHGASSVRSYRPLFPAHQRDLQDPHQAMPEVAEVAREAALAQMRVIDGFIAGRRFIAGERYTIADITAMVALGLVAVVGLTVDPGLAHLTRWYGDVSARPSARA